MLEQMPDRDLALTYIEAIAGILDVSLVIQDVENLIVQGQLPLLGQLQNSDRRDRFRNAGDTK